MASSVYSRALRKAAELLGSEERLARHLGVPAAELRRWIQDEAEPRREPFLRAVDLILDETPAPGGDDDAGPPTPQECAPAGCGRS